MIVIVMLVICAAYVLVCWALLKMISTRRGIAGLAVGVPALLLLIAKLSGWNDYAVGALILIPSFGIIALGAYIFTNLFTNLVDRHRQRIMDYMWKSGLLSRLLGCAYVVLLVLLLCACILCPVYPVCTLFILFMLCIL